MGDMGELGDHTKVLHREVGRYAKDQNIECFYSTGVNSKFASEEFGGNHFHNQEALIGALDAKVSELQALGKNLTILVKGSRSSSMENIVQALVTGEKISC
jgi:UDP-N-acetylmuramoyl-tripeptide--D-alanyl-D-alanine ligase